MSRNGLRILLVDDDAEDALILRDLLRDVREWDCALTATQTYEQGLEEFKKNTHDICLIDYRLGERNGLELLKEAVAWRPDAPIILLTGQGDAAIDREAMRLGAADYLAKGKFDASLLERIIRHALHRAQEASERHRLQTMVVHAEKMSAVGQLAAGVAHEINNPLGVILGFAQALIRRLPPESESEKPLKSIEREALRCRNLVQALLTFSRVSPEGHERVNLNRLIEDALALIRAEAGVAKVHVQTEFQPSLPAILGNSNQIQQIIINLANNAIDAMPQGGTLLVKTKHEESGEHPGVTLHVVDEGTGIPESLLTKIFDPFFTTKPVGKGTGLGLSLVYEIVHNHSAAIDVQSVPGRTEFRIRFPIAA